ncbi:MAG: type II toxin-antitoxin system VapC family toxin [Solirubrobacterales bacterium]
MVVLDTTILIDVLRGSDPAARWLRGLEEVPACSEVTRVEVLRGVRSAERDPTERLLSALRWIPVDEPIGRRAGGLGREHRGSHPGLGVADLLIAATALVLDADLATSNVRHFPMIPGLRPPYRD